ncbi:MAG: LacI family DNA-binding transcriptional regulator [Paracoccaceae bacterium]
MATMAQIARKAGVSLGVVSRIISNDKTLRVGNNTRKRVEMIIKEMNYSPNVMAQSLASSQAGTIAVVLHDIANPVYGEILRGAQIEAARQNKAIILGDASADASSNTKLAQMIGGGGVDGLILQAAGEISDEVIAGAVRQEVPIILLQADMEINAHNIQLPDKEAAIIATRHLVDLGHKRIGCLATGEGLSFTQRRHSGWCEVMGEDANEELVVFAAPNSAGGERGMLELLEKRPDITGLVCFNVVAAVGALRVAKANGFDIPKDLSIIAIHDVKFAQDLWIPLSVVSMPLWEIGEAAVRTVCAPPPEAKTSFQLDLPPKLIIRKSTSALRSVA